MGAIAAMQANVKRWEAELAAMRLPAHDELARLVQAWITSGQAWMATANKLGMRDR